MSAIFIHVPKTGGRSIVVDFNFNQVLQDFNNFKLRDEKVSFGHICIEDLIQRGIVSEEYLDNSFKFSIVRNPYDRCVSLFFYINYTINGKRIDKDDINKYKNEFKEFCKSLNGINPIGFYNRMNDSQANPQERWLSRNGKIFCDYIGRFENYEDSVSYIASKLKEKMPKKLSNIHESETKKQFDYKYFYDDESKRMVYLFYKQDFVCFGYNSEII